jgi:glycine cleavage system H protein
MVPDNLKYAETHEWAKVEGETATIGITSFAVEQLTDVVFVDLKPKVGDKVSSGDSVGEIESVKAVSDLYAPVSGEVTEVNKALAADPSLVSADPYGKGWLIKLKVAAGADAKLKTPADYSKQIATQGH